MHFVYNVTFFIDIYNVTYLGNMLVINWKLVGTQQFNDCTLKNMIAWLCKLKICNTIMNNARDTNYFIKKFTNG